MKLTRVTTIGMIALGVLFLAWLVLTLAFSDTPSRTAPAATDDRHCPRCGRELPRGAGPDDCPYCQMEAASQGKTLKPLGSRRPISPTIPVTIGTVFCILLGIHVYLAVRSRLGQKPEVLYHLRCPKCERKIRYRASQAGRFAQCPLCKKPLIFPKLPESPSGKKGLRTVAKQSAGPGQPTSDSSHHHRPAKGG